MCLAPPDAPEQGWSGVPDILFWIERARDWFRAYEKGGWAIDQAVWSLMAPFRPGPEYRPAGIAQQLFLLPPSWQKSAPAPCGHFRARFRQTDAEAKVGAITPKSPTPNPFGTSQQLGVMVSWTGPEKVRGEWPQGRAILTAPFDDYEGMWIIPDVGPEELMHSALSGTPRYFRDRSLQREVEREEHKLRERARRVGRPWLRLLGGPALWGDEQTQFLCQWECLDLVPDLPPLQQLAALRCMDELAARLIATAPNLEEISEASEQSLHFWPAVPLSGQRLNSRRLAGRGALMQEKLTHSEVVLVGLGALGSEVAHLLAREGIGHFTLVDGDILLPENVARHRADLLEIGRSKVEVARTLIHRANPDAVVTPHHGWLDDLLPTLRRTRLVRPTLFIGMSAHEGTECLVEEICGSLKVPRLHAWLELEGQVLRLFRVLPERDPTFLELETDPGNPLPPLPRREVADLAEDCTDLVLPGSASNIHAAANFVVQVALELLCGQNSETNHWLFAPAGVQDKGLSPELAPLKHRFGVYETTLQKRDE